MKYFTLLTTLFLTATAVAAPGSSRQLTGATIKNGTGVLTLPGPDVTETIVGRATTDTLTNKTLTSPTMTAPTVSSGVLALPAGAVGTPSLTFTGDTTTGLYHLGANDIAWTLGGVLGMEMNNIGSGQINFGMGGAAAATTNAPFTANRTLNAPVFYAWGNPSTGTASGTVFQIVNGTGSNYTTVENWNGTTSGYMAGGSGFFGGTNQTFTVLGSEFSSGNIRFTVGGRTAATERMRLTSTDLNLNLGTTLKFNGSSSGVVTIGPGAAAAGTYSMLLPTAQGAVGTTLVNDGAGTLSWASGGGAGTGAREYLTNTNAEQAVTGWTMYANVAGATPVTGTGGAPASTIVRTTTGSEIIRQTASFKMAKSAANRQGEGVSTDFTVDPQDYKTGSPVYISFDYKTTANYVSSDILTFIYDKDASVLLPVYDANGLSGLVPSSTNGTRFTGYFYPATTTSVNYRLGLHIATTNATAYDFIFDTVHAGAVNFVPGAIITEWTSFTPTGSWSTNTTYLGKWRRVGDSAEVQINLALAGAPTSATLTLNMPSGLVIDTTKLTNGTNGVEAFGQGSIITGSGAAAFGGQVWYSSTTAVLAKAINGSGNAVSVTQAVPGTFGNTDNLNYWFKVPILGWASSAVFNTADALLIAPATTNATSSIKTASATDNWHQLTTNSLTLTSGTWLLFGNCTFNNSGSTATYAITTCGWRSANGNDTNTNPAALSAGTNITLLSAYQDAILSGAPANQSYMPSPTATIKCVGSCTVYLDTYSTETTAANTRITAYANAQKLPDFTIFGIQGIAEYQDSKSSTPTTWPITASQYGDLTSLTLTPGEWDLTGFYGALASGGTVATSIVDIGITTTSGNSATGQLNGENWMQAFHPGTVNLTVPMLIPSYRVTPTVTTTYYLKARFNGAITNLQYNGYRLSARRIK